MRRVAGVTVCLSELACGPSAVDDDGGDSIEVAFTVTMRRVKRRAESLQPAPA